MMKEKAQGWITSRELLEVTGISRATLNNYIRLGIIPRPVVLRPTEALRGVRKIGYFPREVLGRILRVRELKRQGKLVADIARLIKGEEAAERPVEGRKSSGGKELTGGGAGPEMPGRSEDGLKVTFEEISRPAYLVNYRFEIVWLNQKAKEGIFKGAVPFPGHASAVNVFKVLFSRELQARIQNWKDLAGYHMAFAKVKYSRTWIPRFYPGISASAIRLLEELYDRALCPAPEEGITDRPIRLLWDDGSTESFRVWAIFLREGILNVFGPEL